MPALDETDLEILSLLAEDARRPFTEIGEAVGLSGPAVSDRVENLIDAGVVERFTVKVDRSKLRGGAPVLVTVEPAGDPAPVRERFADAEAVEGTVVTAAGEVRAVARVEANGVREWLSGLLDGVDVASRSVTLLDAAEWTPSVTGTEFALVCAECGNAVTSEGETARIGGDVYHFCCPSCRARFAERYDDLADGA